MIELSEHFVKESVLAYVSMCAAKFWSINFTVRVKFAKTVKTMLSEILALYGIQRGQSMYGKFSFCLYK